MYDEIVKFVDVLREVGCGRVVVHKFDELQLLVVKLVCVESAANNASPALSASQQLAYIITTSGTTGLPKIVHVPHQCIVPNITHLRYILLFFRGKPLPH